MRGDATDNIKNLKKRRSNKYTRKNKMFFKKKMAAVGRGRNGQREKKKEEVGVARSSSNEEKKNRAREERGGNGSDECRLYACLSLHQPSLYTQKHISTRMEEQKKMKKAESRQKKNTQQQRGHAYGILSHSFPPSSFIERNHHPPRRNRIGKSTSNTKKRGVNNGQRSCSFQVFFSSKTEKSNDQLFYIEQVSCAACPAVCASE
jgi:hypothetical protein